MGLNEGTLQSLIQHKGKLSALEIDTVLHSMLKALDCLVQKKIVHRDVKPENILYVSLPNSQFQFQLGDFGLGIHASGPKAIAGTALFMAPEVIRGGCQTYKMDVWSLFVTILWTADAGEYRQRCNHFKTAHEVEEGVMRAATVANAQPAFSRIREMASKDPEARASAAQIIVRNYNGDGLCTPRNQVPPLPDRSFPATAAAAAATTGTHVPAPPAQRPNAFGAISRHDNRPRGP